MEITNHPNSHDSALSTARAAMTTTIGIAALVAPQVLLRSVSFGLATNSIWLPFGFGVLVLVLSLAAIRLITLVAPRQAFHQLVAKHIGPWAAVIVSAARIIMFALIIIMGAELITIALSSVTNIETWSAWLPSLLVLLFGLPVLGDNFRGQVSWATFCARIGLLAVVGILGYALVMELIGRIDFTAITAARLEAYEVGADFGAYHPVMEALLAACLPAALLWLVCERIMVPAQLRRLGTRRLGTRFGVLIAVIALTIYFIVLMQLPARRLAIPILSMSAAFFGDVGMTILAIVISAIGAAACYTSYRQLPRLIRELAIDHILPRRLAARDAVAPRRKIVVLIAVLAAVGAWLIDSIHVIAMVLITVCFVLALLGCLSMVSRSRAILMDSTNAEERRSARTYQIVFIIAVSGCIALLVAMAWVQPLWVGIALFCIAIPSIFLFTYRRGVGKLASVLYAEATMSGINLPTRVHGLVLIDSFDQTVLKAVTWARATRLSSLTAVLIDVDPATTNNVRKSWRAAKVPVSLTVLGTPRGSMRDPLIEHIRALRGFHPNDVINVFVPRVVSSGSSDRFFGRLSTPRIVAELELEPGVMVTEVPYRLDFSGFQVSDDGEEYSGRNA